MPSHSFLLARSGLTGTKQIRLPFGRKKKSGTDAPPMPPPLAQTSVIEDPTPAAEDDIEAVKQLCQMGFSRGQAVTALEKYGYDVQRALNSLLGEWLIWGFVRMLEKGAH